MIVYNIPLVNEQKIHGDILPSLKLEGDAPAIIHLSLQENLPSLEVNPTWHTTRYGFGLPQSDITNYLLHYRAWQSFAEREEEWCMIVEESVYLETSYQQIQEQISALSAGWDVYFPFDRLRIRNQEKEFTTNHNNSLRNPNRKEIYDFMPFLLGFYWGSSIYFLSKSGVAKLLQVREIRQRADDEIISLSARKQLNAFFDDVPWFRYEAQPKVKSIDRERDILHTILNTSRWSAETKSQIRTILALISETAAKLDIDLILQGGTHLGYIRHGGIMPWDDDVDIGIEEKHLDTFLQAIADHTPLRYNYQIEEASDTPFYKIWLDGGVPIDEHGHTFPFVDLWMYNRVGDDLVFKNNIVCPNSGKYPFQEVCFEGATLKMTANSLEVLDSRYRTWRSGIRVYNYYHSLERNLGFSLRVPVSVDENGRIILPA
ncbi:LicD family protein [Chitinophaga rhizophila]|uniref:LicD family protein n=1 Tax=Chitinophaga rhizophila TaxID=2866212 RepID=A0ABS7GEB0_9BACT|nr:LicD family protein [Chitinophaga rhizophila]MBW8686006.1 LicD family protein [Chitinophaga rhizophila]